MAQRRPAPSSTSSAGGGSEAVAATPAAPWPLWIRVPVSVGMGLVFGFALQKGRLFEPMVIRDQMAMDKFVMMKVGAIGAVSALQRRVTRAPLFSSRCF